jgi:inner membrane protein
MDNITHSLIGLIAGETLARTTPADARGLTLPRRRNLFVAIGIIGGNSPDLDLLYSYRGSSGDKFAYLLGHRGYTHTVVGCLVLALLLYAAVVAWLRLRRWDASAGDHLALGAAAVVATGLHLGMDALNSYGVHPFWPFENRWLFGDSVYIVEPWYWAAAAPLIFVLRTKIARVLMALALAGMLMFCVVSGLVPPIAWVSLTLAMLLMLGVGRRAVPRAAAVASATAFLMVTAAFVLAGRMAAGQVDAWMHMEFPHAQLLDHVLTPMPANPLCWDVLVLHLDGDRYAAHHGILTLAPELLSAGQCASASRDRQARTLQAISATHDPSMIQRETFSMSKAVLAELIGGHCDAAAFMQFARAPFFAPVGSGWVMGDLRFGQGSTHGFTDIHINAERSDAPCPSTPPWTPPREDLLR